MANLAVNFAGLELKNPFIAASSELTDEFDKIKWAEDAGASAVCTKLAFLNVPFFARPYHIMEKGGGFYSPSGHRLSVEEAQELIRKTKEQTDLKVIANMMGPGENLDGWVKLAQMLEEAGADMVELNMSCPNVGIMAKQIDMDITDELGAHLGKNPALAREVTRKIVDGVNIPVMPKMTPEGQCDIVAKGCEQGGAAAVSGINCPMSLPGCDINDGGKPLYPSTNNQSFAGICGPWIRPLAYRHVAQMRMKCPDLPIAGGGGLSNWRQSVEMIMYGATVLTYCTLFYTDGFKALHKLEKGVRRFMDENGYETLSDFQNIALKHIVTPQNVDYFDAFPVIDQDKCKGCKTCVDLGHCEVMSFDAEKKKAFVAQKDKCYMCGVCFWLCKEKAITMEPA
jgi:dihydropyrimidine dehydrogenase (NAD+) subunit PreA